MSHEPLPAPSPWIARFAPLVAPGARVLDVAAGGGRHARLFASRGARVLAVDRDANALGLLAAIDGIETRVLDLEGPAWPLAGQTFDAIIVANYLHRPLFAHLRAALAPGGVLLYETFAMGNEAYGRPANADFLLCPGELLSLASLAPALMVVAFEQGLVDGETRRAVVQRLAAVGPTPSVATVVAQRFAVTAFAVKCPILVTAMRRSPHAHSARSPKGTLSGPGRRFAAHSYVDR